MKVIFFFIKFSLKGFQTHIFIEPFINFDQGLKPKYSKENDSYSSNIHVEFNTSLPLSKVWYFNSTKINLTDNCQQKSLLAYSCNLHIDLDKESIIGVYILELTNSVYSLSKSIGFDLVLPHKPEVKILKPKYCSSFIACEYNKSIVFQCNIKAHSIDSFRMISLPCKNHGQCKLLDQDLARSTRSKF